MVNAYRKDREDHKETPAETVVVELTENKMSMVQQKTGGGSGKSPRLKLPWTLPGVWTPALRWDKC